MKVTVFSKPSCIPCKFTKRKLDELDVEYEVVDITEHPEAKQKVEELGYRSAPVVEVDLGDNATWHWSGYAPSQLDRLQSLMSA